MLNTDNLREIHKLLIKFKKKEDVQVYIELVRLVKNFSGDPEDVVSTLLKREITNSRFADFKELFDAITKKTPKAISKRLKQNIDIDIPMERNGALRDVLDTEITPRIVDIIRNKDFENPDVPEELRRHAKAVTVAFMRSFAKKDFTVGQRLKIDDFSKIACLSILYRSAFEGLIGSELVDALSFDSLVRLSIVAGGETITVPSFREIEDFIAGVYYYYLVDFKGQNPDKAKKAINNDLHFQYTLPNLKKSYKKYAYYFQHEINKEESTLSESFESLIDSARNMIDKLANSIERLEDPKEITDTYVKLNESLLDLIRGLSKL